MKEEMVNFEGNPLFPKRSSRTVSYPLNEAERTLYEATTEYIQEYYARTNAANRASVGLALSVIQRRLASSTYALLCSLRRREEKLADIVRRILAGILEQQELERQQQTLPTEDIRSAKTADEESAVNGIEEAEQFDLDVMGATSARSLEELEREREEVRVLIRLAQEAYDGQTLESKFERLWQAVQQYPDDKFLIFTEHRDTLRFLVERMEAKGMAGRIATIHGGMDYKEREVQAQHFRSDDGLYLIATDAAGEGINLQFCRFLINYDVPWNPARLEQRMGRIHRYKQDRDVVLFNFIAENTREGSVLETLLEKTERIKESLDDRVFDVIGEQFQNINISELIFQATVGGKDAEVVATINATLTENAILQRLDEQKRRVELTEVRGVLQALNERRANAEIRRMMPSFVREHFVQMTERLGIVLDGELRGLFALRDVPDTVRKALESYPPELRDNLTFDRSLALPPKSLTPVAVYLHPGELVYDAVANQFLGLFDAEAQRGGIFYDETAEEPRLFFLAKVPVVRDVLDSSGIPNGERETLTEVMTGVCIRTDGTCEAVAPHLLLTLTPAESGTVASVPDALKPYQDDRDSVSNFVLTEFGLGALETVQKEIQDRMPEREKQIRQSYNLRLAEGMEQRMKLKQEVEKGTPAADTKLRRLMTELSALDAVRDAAIADLKKEYELVTLGPVTIYSRALVLPDPIVTAERKAQAEAEQIAVALARKYEEERGAVVEDVSNPALAMGFDLRATRPDGTVRYIEVKGRSGTANVHLTDNEWKQAVNHRDRYWLYVVYGCETDAPTLYRVCDPFGTLIASSGGVILSAGDIKSAAAKPNA